MTTRARFLAPAYVVPCPLVDGAQQTLTVKGIIPNTLTPEHSTNDASARPKRHMRLMGAPIDVVTEVSAVQNIIDAAETGRGHWTITANLDHLRRYHLDPIQKALIDNADLVVADGMPLIWASRLAGEPLPERVSGSSMVWSICKAASAHRLSVFLLGGDPSVAEVQHALTWVLKVTRKSLGVSNVRSLKRDPGLCSSR
jgi:hypothetical protein